jgi:hypothetical protein
MVEAFENLGRYSIGERLTGWRVPPVGADVSVSFAPHADRGPSLGRYSWRVDPFEDCGCNGQLTPL